MLAKFYNKKPDVIEAIQFVYTEEGMQELKRFCGDELLIRFYKDRHPGAIAKAELSGPGRNRSFTPTQIACEGDFVVKDVGKFSVIKSDIFRSTYEEQH